MTTSLKYQTEKDSPKQLILGTGLHLKLFKYFRRPNFAQQKTSIFHDCILFLFQPTIVLFASISFCVFIFSFGYFSQFHFRIFLQIFCIGTIITEMDRASFMAIFRANFKQNERMIHTCSITESQSLLLQLNGRARYV